VKKGNAGRYDDYTLEGLLGQKNEIKPKGGTCLLAYKHGKKEQEVLNENGHEADDDKKNNALFKNKPLNQMDNQVNQYI
jgi:hypothetical protein